MSALKTILLFTFFPLMLAAQDSLMTSGNFSGLRWRSVGPALTSGRVVDFAVNPNNPNIYYVASASGGIWKTDNDGTTFTPVFDNEGSYSIGCITLDPNNSNVVWAGTGENNNQRSVGYGDGVYKSSDGGKSWTNMGLKNSEHIGMIAVDPRNPDVVYVAAYGPLWSAGGDRGLYKTSDGGKSWEKVLNISQYTGVNEVHLDPRNPDIIYATAHQRMRKVWTYIGGGPESAIYKSKDGGKTWKKIMNGLPQGVDVGRIGMDISPVNPDVLYAIVEAAEGKGGFFTSTDRGESWTRMSKRSTSGNYYQEIFCDPKDINKVYSLDTWGAVTRDGGKTWSRIGNKWRHVDDHALWINPENTDNILIGCDGGIYESSDGGKNWMYKANLPITQFYKVTVDNEKPFYYIYGGTQDNNSMGGPSRTINQPGIMNSDWFITNGGDGFESAVDPEDPNIVYAQSQYGWLFRYDKNSGEKIMIKPQERKGDKPYRWNWDAPLFISPHSHNRLYFAANRVFKSDDRGNTWQVISPDLTRQNDRNKMRVMGRTWSVDAVMKNKSTSIYHTIVSLTESPVKEGLIYSGTDDGLIWVTEDGGQSWQKIDHIKGIPEPVYVDALLASSHDENIVYAVFNNHKNGDFKPYVLKSTDRGKTWTNISSTLPDKGAVYALAESPERKGLIFAGTEYGFFFSMDDGQNWTQLKAGLPTICVRDIAIQQRDKGIAIATFGRGFYVLDDYTPLLNLKKEDLNKEAFIFPIQDSWMFNETNPLGYRGKGFQGSAFYTADNPPVGATFTYYLKQPFQTLKAQRRKKEKELEKKGKDVSYPSMAELRKEDREEEPFLLFLIKDEAGNVVRRLNASATATGINRITWDFRYPSVTPAKESNAEPDAPWDQGLSGVWALPGTYYVSMYKYENGKTSRLSDSLPFNIKLLKLNQWAPENRDSILAFQKEVNSLYRVMLGASEYAAIIGKKLKLMEVAIKETPEASYTWMEDIQHLRMQLDSFNIVMHGDQSRAGREFPTQPSMMDRVSLVSYALMNTSFAPTTTMIQQYKLVAGDFSDVLSFLKQIDRGVQSLENKLEKAHAPYTPGRFPEWNHR